MRFLKSKTQIQKKVIQEKLSGKEIVAELEKLGYFNLTNESELDTVKADFQKAYTDLNFFQGQCGETFEFYGQSLSLGRLRGIIRDWRIDWIFRPSQTDFWQTWTWIKIWKRKKNKTKIVETHDKIELNGIEYIAFDEQFSDLDWGIAYVNFIEMLNAELKTKFGRAVLSNKLWKWWNVRLTNTKTVGLCKSELSNRQWTPDNNE